MEENDPGKQAFFAEYCAAQGLSVQSEEQKAMPLGICKAAYSKGRATPYGGKRPETQQ